MNNVDVARRLKVKAEHDEQAAQALFQLGMTADIICFHCHQAIEKYIKSVLAKHDVSFPRSHDLEELVELAAEIVADLNELPEHIFLMTQYAVMARYGEVTEPDMHDAKQALQYVTQVKHILMQELVVLGGER